MNSSTTTLEQRSRKQSRGVPPRTGPGRPGSVSGRGAFTLVEMMISIALVLLLILGINQVFKYTTQAVGAGETINADIRASRAFQTQLSNDIGDIVPPGTGPTDSACLIINAQQAYAYRNKADLAAEGDTSSAPTIQTVLGQYNIPAGAPYQDLAGTGKFGDPTVPGDVTYPYTYNSRSHRLDVLSFFARDLFHRQTGNPGTYVDDMAAQEAWIWYGHLQLPDNLGSDIDTDFPHSTSALPGQPDTFPCAGTPALNPNNCFASQLVLGRVQIGLVPKNTSGKVAPETDSTGAAQWFVDSNNSITSYLQGPLDPLAMYSSVNKSAVGASDPAQVNSSGQYYLPDARVDLANTSIAQFRNLLLSYITKSPTQDWWDPMMDGNPRYQTNGKYTRFKCNPFVSKPMQSANMAFASPYLIGGCSQFIVEYAGDYLTQDNNPNDVVPTTTTSYGQITAVAPDGQVDYQVITDPVTGVKRKQIIWYGMPRNTSGIATNTQNPGSGRPSCSIANGDVAPLSFWINAPLAQGGAAGMKNPYTFERVLPDFSSNTDLTSMEAGSQYTCAWGPNDPKPALIRITFTIDDPTGRLPDGQTYQFVFAVP